MDIRGITKSTDNYNLHSHTTYCDGHASLRDMTNAAQRCGMLHYGVSPHSPIPIVSSCNMSEESVKEYLYEMERLRGELEDSMRLWTGMEIDYLGKHHGAHTDYFQELPLDYRIGSVHFVPNQEGIYIDCDGKAERFAENLKRGYANDIRYVTERYFEQVLLMLEAGGFDILGHPDKIAANASSIDTEIENQGWYKALIEDVANLAATTGVIVEINTKAFTDKKRFFPATRWWKTFIDAGCDFVVNSDAHWPDRINSGREEALTLLRSNERVNQNRG